MSHTTGAIIFLFNSGKNTVFFGLLKSWKIYTQVGDFVLRRFLMEPKLFQHTFLIWHESNLEAAVAAAVAVLD